MRFLSEWLTSSEDILNMKVRIRHIYDGPLRAAPGFAAMVSAVESDYSRLQSLGTIRPKEATRETDELAAKIVVLLGSEDWESVLRGCQLFRSPDSPIEAADLLGAISPALAPLATLPGRLVLRLRVYEEDHEECTFVAGTESWQGGVVHGGKGTATVTMETDDIETLSMLIGCFRNSAKSIIWVRGFEPPDAVNGMCSEYYHLDAQGQRVDGQPSPSDPDMAVEITDYDSVECTYFPHAGLDSVPTIDWKGKSVEPHHINALILALALLSGIDLEKLD